jgi:DNA-binding HxlR family transcriptional regulator
MKNSYGQFCPVAKASEIFATRWTPLLLRELIAGACTFNDILRGVPLMPRALLAERLRQLEYEGILEKRAGRTRGSTEYWLTPAGDAFREVIDGLGRWGAFYARDRINPSDLDPGLFLWMLRRRVSLPELPDRRIVLQFEFSGVAASKTKLRRMWLVLDPPDIDVCMKDPGHAVDLTLKGDIAVFVAIFLGHAKWSEKAGSAIDVEGESAAAKRLPVWLGL